MSNAKSELVKSFAVGGVRADQVCTVHVYTLWGATRTDFDQAYFI